MLALELAFLLVVPVWPRPSAQLEQQRQQLHQLQRSIEQLQAQVQRYTSQELSTQQRLQQLQRYRRLLERSLALQARELQRLDDSLQRLHRKLLHLREHREELGHHQRLLLHRFYLSGSSNMPNEFSVRLRHYVHTLLTYSLQKSEQLQREHDTMAELRNQLQALQQQRLLWLQRHQYQRQELERTIQQQERLLATLRSQRQSLERLLRERQRDARQLQRTIERLAAEAARHRKPIPPSATPKSAPPAVASLLPSPHSPTPIGPHPSLAWPSSSRRLLRSYGTQRNAETGIVWTNAGIDIATPRESPVRAVAPGTVKLIHWLPTYQGIVVVEHANNLRSVYANLQTVAVRPGSTVSTGTVLGTSGSTPDGEGFHFQLWHGRQHLNPLEWLR